MPLIPPPPENASVDAFLSKEIQEPVLEPGPAHRRRAPPPLGPAKPRAKFYTAAEIEHEIRCSGHNVVSTVYVQGGSFHLSSGPAAFRPCGEVEFAQGVAAQCDAGVYGGAARLCAGYRGGTWTCAARARRRVVARMAGQPELPGAVGHGSPAELPQLAALAKEFPSATIVVNHCGTKTGPPLSEDGEKLALWRANMAELGECPNVYAKLGGTAMVECGLGLEKREAPVGSDELLELTFPYYEHVIKSFGAAKCMFESNYPVERDVVSYRTLWNTFKKIYVSFK
ncbi:hypothetical protein TeGR_g2997 [Tetraparma gracilis]|uniref:Amidohydrolase-related domain-containing protein n=1 Tax=Tetraparma gracilis TaxID=2962635 RepID=A0ABQ6N3V9_9STRA|nr:hypothetical protein TeGR_g2997 [Tetraparma gracilis]